MMNESETSFDVWEYPFPCLRCGRYDNNDPMQPTAYLDARTNLCEFCFIEKEENKEGE